MSTPPHGLWLMIVTVVTGRWSFKLSHVPYWCNQVVSTSFYVVFNCINWGCYEMVQGVDSEEVPVGIYNGLSLPVYAMGTYVL